MVNKTSLDGVSQDIDTKTILSHDVDYEHYVGVLFTPEMTQNLASIRDDLNLIRRNMALWATSKSTDNAK